MATLCDVCGERDGTTARGDLLICAPCAAGTAEDRRPPCPRCTRLIPHSYSLATWNDDNIFEQRCPFCGHVWDERSEGRDADGWRALGVEP